MYPTKTFRATWSQISFLGAACALFSLLELAIPRFVPFFRLGLGNLVLLLAIFLGLNFKSYFSLVLLKVLSQAIIGGTLLSYVFLLSLSSALVGSSVMYVFSRLFRANPHFSLISASLLGALGSNTTQVLVASIFLGSETWLLFVPVAGLGLLTSLILGIISNRFTASGSFVEIFRARQPSALPEDTRPSESSKGSLVFQAVLIVLLLSILFVKNLCYQAFILVITMACKMLIKQKVHLVRVFATIMIVTSLSLASPLGKVLLSVAGFPITLTALEDGLLKALVMNSTIALSSLCLKTINLRRFGFISTLLSYQALLLENFNTRRRTEGNLLKAADKALVDSYQNTGKFPQA